MNRISELKNHLSADSLAALAAQRNDNLGAVVQLDPVWNVGRKLRCLAELRALGAIGQLNGLTTIGAALAGRLQAEKMDDLFG